MPFFEHDCKICVYLGSTEQSGRMWDMYFCTQGSDSHPFPTVIARFGNDGPEYLSGLFIAQTHFEQGDLLHPLVEARSRAIQRGFLNAQGMALPPAPSVKLAQDGYIAVRRDRNDNHEFLILTEMRDSVDAAQGVARSNSAYNKPWGYEYPIIRYIRVKVTEEETVT